MDSTHFLRKTCFRSAYFAVKPPMFSAICSPLFRNKRGGLTPVPRQYFRRACFPQRLRKTPGELFHIFSFSPSASQRSGAYGAAPPSRDLPIELGEKSRFPRGLIDFKKNKELKNTQVWEFPSPVRGQAPRPGIAIFMVKIVRMF